MGGAPAADCLRSLLYRDPYRYSYLYSDSHAHLDRYSEDEVAGMLRRARAAGVGLILTVGSDLESSRRAVALAHSYPALRAAVGLHPLHLDGTVDDDTYAALERLAREGGLVVAEGEVGLDYVEGRASPRAQRQALCRMAGLAVACRLPLICHSRGAGADADTLAVLAEAAVAPGAAALHYFVGDGERARRYQERGVYISVGRPLAKPDGDALRTVVREVPLEWLLVETDTYPLPGRRTEPADVVEVVAALAQVKGLSVPEAGRVTTANLRRFLRI